MAILINNSLEYRFLKVVKDPEGRFLQITLEIANLYTLKFINVYGPNHDSTLWYKNLFSATSDFETDYTIYLGDWNVCLGDRDFYTYNTLRNPKGNSEINDNIAKLGLNDIWRLQNPDETGSK